MRTKYLFIALFIALVMTGCASKNDSLVESFMGTAFTLQKHNQIVAVEQQPSAEPITQLNGEAAVFVTKRYVDGFKKAEGPEYSLKD